MRELAQKEASLVQKTFFLFVIVLFPFMTREKGAV